MNEDDCLMLDVNGTCAKASLKKLIILIPYISLLSQDGSNQESWSRSCFCRGDYPGSDGFFRLKESDG